MSIITLLDCKIYLDGYNLSGYHNQITLDYGAEMLDDTVFGTSGTRSFKPGLKTLSATGNVFWDSEQDIVNFNRIGAVRAVLSLAPEGNAEGDPVFLFQGVNGTYNPVSGEVGALAASEFDVNAANTQLVRGRVLAIGSKSVTGSGAGVNVGAAITGQKIYSALHVTAVAATSIDVIVESSVDNTFAAPTTRLTHAQFTNGGGVGADWQELAGPITDTWWRSKWTIVGGPFVIYHTFGIY